MQRRSILKAAAGAAAALGVPHLYAQAWPTGPVRIVVGFPPGGGTDALARVVGQKLGTMWNRQVIVETKAPGSPGCSRPTTWPRNRATAASC
jgi:tripartite-type tricarboxylate transporter receptor subunit TctC